MDRAARLVGPPSEFWLTRIVFLRALGFIYLVAFFSLFRQLKPLIGENGLYPAPLFLERIAQSLGGAWAGFLRLPTIFWLHCSDGFMLAVCGLGVVLSLLLLAGVSNAVLLFLLWALYFSLHAVGQLFYGYGWEIMLLEGGFLAIFL